MKAERLALFLLQGVCGKGPLSPYLFIFCAERLSRLLQDSIHRGSLHGYRISQGGPQISHLFFADDNLVFFRANVQEALEIKCILRIYENASR